MPGHARPAARHGQAITAVGPRSVGPGTRSLILGGCALGDHHTAVEHHDPVSQGVGLLEVVSGEHDAATERKPAQVAHRPGRA